MWRMDSLPSDLHWRITFNKKFFCLAPMIFSWVLFLCVYLFIMYIKYKGNHINTYKYFILLMFIICDLNQLFLSDYNIPLLLFFLTID